MIIRPTETRGAATAALNGLIKSGLFLGQSPMFFRYVHALAVQADAARQGTARPAAPARRNDRTAIPATVVQPLGDGG